MTRIERIAQLEAKLIAMPNFPMFVKQLADVRAMTEAQWKAREAATRAAKVALNGSERPSEAVLKRTVSGMVKKVMK